MEDRAMKCVEVREALPAFVRGTSDPSLAVRRHLSRCVDCRREAATYDSIARAMGSLRAVNAEPSLELRDALYAISDRSSPVEAIRGHVARNRNAYLGGAAVAVAGAVGAAVWQSRRARPVAVRV